MSPRVPPYGKEPYPFYILYMEDNMEEVGEAEVDFCQVPSPPTPDPMGGREHFAFLSVCLRFPFS